MIVVMGMADLRGNLSFKVQRFYGFPGFYTMKRREETKHRLIIGSYKGAGILSKEKRRMPVSDFIADLGDHLRVMVRNPCLAYLAGWGMDGNDQFGLCLEYIPL